MSTNAKKLEVAASGVLAQEEDLTPEKIRLILKQLSSLPGYEIEDEQVEQLARDFEVRLQFTMKHGAALTRRDYVPWLEASRHEIDDYYWDRYRRWLVNDKRFPTKVVATLDDVTDRILGLMENPKKDGDWDRRGLVVGHVQSGKTANYTGLICKAADAGYRLIVVIAGVHNNLRNQTQQRIDEGLVGYDSSWMKARKGQRFIGVGRYDSSRQPITFTTSKRDFSKGVAEQLGANLASFVEPAVFVIKKNSSTLRNLLEWLSSRNARWGKAQIDYPLLVIDDEADNASINTRYGKGEVSRINQQLRELLNMFSRSCYLGYTATPFANIFVDPDSTDDMIGDDLFPRDFIVSLDPPSNYFGSEKVFLNEEQGPVRPIADNEPYLPIRHKKGHTVDELPPSLLDALRTFVVARAIRLARGHEREHCSMLVNASRFTDVQTELRNAIRNRLERIQNSTRLYAAADHPSAQLDPEMQALKDMFVREYGDVELTWTKVQRELHVSSAPIKVVEVNSRSSQALNYAGYNDSGLNVIAVGGYSLSRGLTLEGLMVSYYLRNSMMYDTLMQMARWFGYRPGYEDLCRIWMPEEAEGWYQHIAESIEQLRDELRSMEAAGATPQEFGLKVRSHPDNLVVTARNKMGSGERLVVQIGLGNSFVETPLLKSDPESLAHNRFAASQLIEDLKTANFKFSDQQRNGYLIQHAPSELVKRFLQSFRGHPGATLSSTQPLLDYISKRDHDELAEWDVLFVSLSDGSTPVDNSLGIPIHPQTRSPGLRTTDGTLYISDKQRVASRGIERTGLTAEQIQDAENQYLKSLLDEGKQNPKKNFPDRIYRWVRSRPLLIVHLLQVKEREKVSGVPSEPVVAWGISFPRPRREESTVEYVVNTTWMKEYAFELEEEDYEGDA